MDANTRRIKEGKQFQGADERIAYTLTTTPWGSSPASLVVKLWDVTTDPDMQAAAYWTDVSTTKLSGSASAIGDVITTPLVIGLVAGNLYRCEVQFVCSGNTFEAWALIEAQP